MYRIYCISTLRSQSVRRSVSCCVVCSKEPHNEKFVPGIPSSIYIIVIVDDFCHDTTRDGATSRTILLVVGQWMGSTSYCCCTRQYVCIWIPLLLWVVYCLHSLVTRAVRFRRLSLARFRGARNDSDLTWCLSFHWGSKGLLLLLIECAFSLPSPKTQYLVRRWLFATAVRTRAALGSIF